MVEQNSTPSTRGLVDWQIQRLSAVVILLYALYMTVFICWHHPLHYTVWQQLFQAPLMKMATLLAVFCVVAHAWIGLWTVFTDYIHHLMLRHVIQAIVMLVLFGMLLGAVFILWG